MGKSANPLASCIVLGCLLFASSGAALAQTVVVRPGDTLSIIAERELGDRNLYKEICELNLRVLRHDCDYLVVGTELALPGRSDVRVVTARAATSDKREPGQNPAPGKTFLVRLSPANVKKLNAPDGYWAQPRSSYASLSGYQADASSGLKPGIWLQLPESFEKNASGKTILVNAVVRMRRTPGPFALTYSTHEVGNSGWITKTAGTTFKTVSFTYRVSEMKKGNGDYIGILPDPKGFGQVLHLAEISVSILPD